MNMNAIKNKHVSFKCVLDLFIPRVPFQCVLNLFYGVTVFTDDCLL